MVEEFVCDSHMTYNKKPHNISPDIADIRSHAIVSQWIVYEGLFHPKMKGGISWKM